VARQDAEIPLLSGDFDFVDVVVDDRALGRDEFEAEVLG
jgi:hypothetical protein